MRVFYIYHSIYRTHLPHSNHHTKIIPKSIEPRNISNVINIYLYIPYIRVWYGTMVWYGTSGTSGTWYLLVFCARTLAAFIFVLSKNTTHLSRFKSSQWVIRVFHAKKFTIRIPVFVVQRIRFIVPTKLAKV